MIAGKISDFLQLCDKYYCNEKTLFNLIKKALFDVLVDKEIVSIDMEKSLIYELKNGKIIPIKIKKSHQKEIQKRLIELLEKRRNKIFLSGNYKKIKDFYKDLLGEYNRFVIANIEENSVFLEIKNKSKKIPERLVFMVNIDDFLDQDMIAIGHNFLFFIKSIEFENEKTIIKMTRKKAEIIEKELECVFDLIEKKYGTRIDYKLNFVDFKSKKVVMFVKDNQIEPILKSIKKTIKSRLGFDIFWKIRKEKRDEKR